MKGTPALQVLYGVDADSSVLGVDADGNGALNAHNLWKAAPHVVATRKLFPGRGNLVLEAIRPKMSISLIILIYNRTFIFVTVWVLIQ